MVVAGTYARVEAAPAGPMAALLAVPRGIIAGADVIITILFVGGAFALLDRTGALARLVGALVGHTRRPRTVVTVIHSPTPSTTPITLGASGTTQLSPETRRVVLEVQSSGPQTLPSEFALHQNYPNPFNPTTSIRYDLPVESRVRLVVYNLLGVVVSKLVDQVQPAGYHIARWEPAEASGIYLYRIEAAGTQNSSGSFRDVKRMVVIK